MAEVICLGRKTVGGNIVSFPGLACRAVKRYSELGVAKVYNI
jgi:hypothetical protein